MAKSSKYFNNSLPISHISFQIHSSRHILTSQYTIHIDLTIHIPHKIYVSSIYVSWFGCVSGCIFESMFDVAGGDACNEGSGNTWICKLCPWYQILNGSSEDVEPSMHLKTFTIRALEYAIGLASFRISLKKLVHFGLQKWSTQNGTLDGEAPGWGNMAVGRRLPCSAGGH